jgi:hypothetical protein
MTSTVPEGSGGTRSLDILEFGSAFTTVPAAIKIESATVRLFMERLTPSKL